MLTMGVFCDMGDIYFWIEVVPIFSNSFVPIAKSWACNCLAASVLAQNANTATKVSAINCMAIVSGFGHIILMAPAASNALANGLNTSCQYQRHCSSAKIRRCMK